MFVFFFLVAFIFLHACVFICVVLCYLCWIDKLSYTARLEALTQTPVDLLRITFQIKTTLVSHVSSSSKGLHLVLYANDFLLSTCVAVAEIVWVCIIQRIRQNCHFCRIPES